MKIRIILLCLTSLIFVGCTTSTMTSALLPLNMRSMNIHTEPQPSTYTMNMVFTEKAMSNKYNNLDYGIRLNIQDSRAQKNVVQRYDGNGANLPKININPGIGSFCTESFRSYMRTMGFQMGSDVATDYLLQIDVKEFHVDYISGIGWQGVVKLNISVYDHTHSIVYSNVEAIGRANQETKNYNSFASANQALNAAFANVMKDIDWDRIASFLHRAASPREEAKKKVTGDGSSTLEHLVVHWNINSRPQGADVYWRVISKTPDVKNQNYKYLETTPYEGSETLDIKGLSYENAGLVQIEIKVEKEGYFSQTKKHDVLSLIDDNDINYMFRLVKETE